MRLLGAMIVHLLLFAVVATPALAEEVEGRTKPTLQIAPARYGPTGSIMEASWLAPERIETDAALASAPPPVLPRFEFPPEEFSFLLVEYSSPIRIVRNEMLFRFEAPGAGKALVSCEFIF
jgi:hypothetical protein